jgi:hypothetical protein
LTIPAAKDGWANVISFRGIIDNVSTMLDKPERYTYLYPKHQP